MSRGCGGSGGSRGGGGSRGCRGSEGRLFGRFFIGVLHQPGRRVVNHVD